ncbi:MAG: Uma2 family endonuclease [Prochloron sp. SP5CPC1]|nr:Uma2 family endonuclease [Candidatus Paraprochloron terpiosi SP5CPC1]
MKWQEVIEHPSLQDLPFKIELNEHGKIEMSPASNRHGRLQGIIYSLLGQYPGELYLECSINTSKGVKVADVAWCSPDFFNQYGEITPLPASPEIWIEILSPSNSQGEMKEKISLYLAQGAQEVWLCDNEGNIEFHTSEGVSSKSLLLHDFPKNIFEKG